MTLEHIADLEHAKFTVDGNNSYVNYRQGVNGAIDESNSSHAALGGGATFTGTAVDILRYSIVYVTVYADQASATDGLVIEQGQDEGGTIYWDSDDKFTIPASTGKTFSIQPAMQYLRVRYTNGATPQTAFRLHVVLKTNNGLDSTHRIQDAIVDEDDVRLRKSVLSAKTDVGTYLNIGATDSGNLRVTDAESGLAIAKGDVTGTEFIHKFGEAPDFDTGDGFAHVWDGANDGGIYDVPSYTYSTTADIDSLVSNNAGDTMDIEVLGLDANYAVVTQTVTLTGQTRVALPTPLFRVFRMKNVGSTDVAGTVACYVDVAAPGGVVSTAANVRAIISDGNNQTLMALYTIPAGKTGYMRDWYASISRTRGTLSTIKLFAKPEGQVFQLKHISSIDNAGTSYVQHQYVEPEVFAEKTDIQILANCSVNTTGVSAGFDIVLVDN